MWCTNHLLQSRRAVLLSGRYMRLRLLPGAEKRWVCSMWCSYMVCRYRVSPIVFYSCTGYGETMTVCFDEVTCNTICHGYCICEFIFIYTALPSAQLFSLMFSWGLVIMQQYVMAHHTKCVLGPISCVVTIIWLSASVIVRYTYHAHSRGSIKSQCLVFICCVMY